jgi:hypothetical protein
MVTRHAARPTISPSVPWPAVAACAGAIALAGITGTHTPAHAANGAAPDTRWTFASLGDQDVTWTPKRKFNRDRLSFRLPIGRPRPEDWFILTLRYRVTFQPSRRLPGAAYLEASCNEVGCALVRFRTDRSKDHNVIAIASSGAIDGVIERAFRRPPAVGSFRNFFPQAGIRPGRNVIRFGVKITGRSPLKRIVIENTSTITRTRRGPAKIVVREVVPARGVRTHQNFQAYAIVTNLGDRLARNISVTLDYDLGTLAPSSPTHRSIPRLDPQDRRVVTFALRSRARPATTHLGVSILGSSNEAAAVEELAIRERLTHPKPPANGGDLSRWLAGIILLAMILLVSPTIFLVRRRRKRAAADGPRASG